MTDLNTLNYLNLIGYIINFLVTFASASVFSFPDNAELSEKYQTIITPSGGTFAIWGIIFISQGIFAVIQMLSGYRSNPLVQEAVSYYYFAACMFQSLWTFAFGYEIISLSWLMMGGILASLIPIVLNQSKIELEPSTEIRDFWLLKFPFSVHCGWIAAAFAVNANIFALVSGAQAGAQEACAFATLGYAVVFACFALLYLSPPDFTIPSVLVWACLGIAMELRNPTDAIMATFSDAAIARVRISVIGVGVILAIVTAVYGVKRVLKKGFTTAKGDGAYNGDRFED